MSLNNFYIKNDTNVNLTPPNDVLWPYLDKDMVVTLNNDGELLPNKIVSLLSNNNILNISHSLELNNYIIDGSIIVLNDDEVELTINEALDYIKFLTKGDVVEIVRSELSNNINELILETQTIASEDNNIELNYNGTKLSSNGGGITVVNGISNGTNSELIINSDGDWTSNNYIIPNGFVFPFYTPTSTNDNYGNINEITVDSDYIYLKTASGWRRSAFFNTF